MISSDMLSILNCCWAATVLASILVWRKRGKALPARGDKGLASSVTVLVCAAVLLFPFISANDDLEYVVQACEDGRSCVSDGTNLVSHYSDDKWTAAVTPPQGQCLLLKRIIGCIIPLVPQRQVFGYSTPWEVRPPPLSTPAA
jgi:hypothetical protein